MKTNSTYNLGMPPLPKDRVVLIPSPFEIDLARIIGDQRYKGHDHCRKETETFPGQRRADRYGALAEVTVIQALFRAGLHPTDLSVLADRPVPGPDFCLGGLTFDIKTCPLPDRVQPKPAARYVSVNEAARLDHPPDVYLSCVYEAGFGSMAMGLFAVPASDVATWELRQGHSPYRSKNVRYLRPLARLEDLLTLAPAEAART